MSTRRLRRQVPSWNYERRFTVQASHISDAGYPHLYTALDAGEHGVHDIAYRELFQAMLKTHGHNFRIVVRVTAGSLTREGFSVDDVKITEAVMEWNGINLSLHPDFFNLKDADGRPRRATTERMAEVLWTKLDRLLVGANRIRVTVFETEDVRADYPIE